MTPLEGLQAAVLGPNARKIIDALAKVYPERLSAVDLAAMIFEGDDGPEWEAAAIYEAIRKLRPQIELYGWTIPKATRLAGYRLQPMGRR